MKIGEIVEGRVVDGKYTARVDLGPFCVFCSVPEPLVKGTVVHVRVPRDPMVHLWPLVPTEEKADAV